MKFLSKVATIVLGGSLLFTQSPVKASSDHDRLWDSLEEVGVTILVNDPHFCLKNDIDGAYVPSAKVLVVCQDNASPMTSGEVQWTANDLDTLRHEAHHVVQDCLAGELGDKYSDLFFDNEEEFTEFVKGILNERQIELIVESYRSNGADDQRILMEIEAFAVASGISPDMIADAVTGLCEV